MSSEHILTDKPPAADERISYGSGPFQFGDLRLPKGKGPHPLLMMIHGGFWRAKYDLVHTGHLCAALAKSGIATWNLEFRRVGNDGGGWPGTFEDVRAGLRFLDTIAKKFHLNTDHTVVMGHSAGGQLALCLAAHHENGHERPPIRGAVSLAGVVDLRRGYDLHLSNDAVVEFLGGTPEQIPDHYQEASPAELKIPKIPQRLVHGKVDDTVPFAMSQQYRDKKKAWREDVELLELPRAGHFEVVDPLSAVWPEVEKTIRKLFSI